MPRYFLHIRDNGVLVRDLEGVELPSVIAAKREAEQAAREILAQKVEAGEIIDGQAFEIYDGWGNHMLTIPFKSVLKLK